MTFIILCSQSDCVNRKYRLLVHLKHHLCQEEFELLILSVLIFSYISVISKLYNKHTLPLKFQVFWDVVPCHLVNSYDISEKHCLHLRGLTCLNLKMEALHSSEMITNIFQLTHCKCLRSLEM